MINLILCGGNGTRLWPLSRTLMPKQFLKIFDNESLFQLTIKRNSKFCKSSIIVSNTEQYFLAIDQLENLNIKNCTFLLEPIARNTAPAIALACMSLKDDDIVLVTPSDHLIKNEAKYKEVLDKAQDLAKNNYLVTFGIKPNFAETGFGYIESINEFDVKAFHEKPDFKTAASYLKSGNCYWNSGMFCFKVSVFLNELKKYSPEIYKTSKSAFESSKSDVSQLIEIQQDFMSKIPENSIDYAVMEKSNIVKVIPSDIGWSDVGSFDCLYSELEKDSDGNTISSNYISINSKNNLIYSNEKLIATIDLQNFIVVDTKDALLISKKGSSQKVKEIVKKLKEQNSELPTLHSTVSRPWGTYTVLEDTPGYKIKRIVVKPGKRLSLQKHFHRNEHWIVVSGTATVQVGDVIKLVRPNESTYIKMGEIHRLSNDGKIPVILIEAQVGEYTGEDDIVRIEDDFNRK